MQVQKDNKIGEIVAANFRAAQIFESFGLDFCCGGKKSISDACKEKELNPEKVISELSKIDEKQANLQRFEKWEADFLIDYIINNHHQYVVYSIPAIENHLQKLASKHGEKHHELVEIQEIFSALKDELLNHMQKEEKMLFPYIKKLKLAVDNSHAIPLAPFGAVENPLRVLESEHESAGKMMSDINKLSSGYKPPEDACGTYRVLYNELNEFENDLHMHIHLENNILFPKALELESKLAMIHSGAVNA